jgi:GDP-4-dehydro-6-deoxy-D-mannose reductase
VRVLITGADGFAGSWLARELLAANHSVAGTTLSEGPPAAPTLTAAERAAVEWRRMDLASDDSVQAALQPSAGQPWDGIVHLAAIAWSRDAAERPEVTRDINVAGTARVVAAAAELRRQGLADPTVIVASSGEVYGRDHDGAAHTELDPTDPLSPYSRSKLDAEREATRLAGPAGVRLILARLFPHTGPGQRPVFVTPALLTRLRAARQSGATEIPTGDLSPVRDFLDVRDVATAYRALLELRPVPGVYNVASGVGRRLQDIFDQLARLVGVRAQARPEVALRRPWDVPHLVGDASRLRAATGWVAAIPFEQTLTDLVNAETH